MIPSVQVFQNLSVVSAGGPHALAGSRRAAVQVFELLLFEGVCSSVPHLSFRGEGMVFPRVCATEQPLRELEEDMSMSSGDDMQVAVFPARISMSGRHHRKTQPLLMFGFDRNGLQVGQVTSWVFVVGLTFFSLCILGSLCATLWSFANMAHFARHTSPARPHS